MTQAELLNILANDPTIARAIAPGYQDIDLSHFFDNPRNVMLGDERGVALFAYQGNEEFEGHYLLTRHLRGAPALRRMRTWLYAIFTEYGATAINGTTPRTNRAARAVNRALGFRPVGVLTDTLGRPCLAYRLDRATWARQLADSLEVLARS